MRNAASRPKCRGDRWPMTNAVRLKKTPMSAGMNRKMVARLLVEIQWTQALMMWNPISGLKIAPLPVYGLINVVVPCSITTLV